MRGLDLRKSGGAPAQRSVTVGGSTGVLATINRLLGGSSTLSLISGTNANLTLVNGNQISAATAIAAGTSQTAVVREVLGSEKRAVEYPIVFTRPGATVTLTALTLSAASLAENSASATAVGTVLGQTSGSTVTLVDDAGGRFALSGSNLVAGATAANFEAATSHSITLRETLAGAANSPRDTVLTINVTNVYEQPNLVALTLSSGTATVGNSQTINIIGATSGSTITGAVPDGMTLNSSLRTIAGTPTIPGTYNFALTETLADSANSPRTSNVSIVVGGIARPTLFAPDMPLIRTGDSISARADNTDWPLWANFFAWGRFRIPGYGYHAISASEINEPASASPRVNPKDVLRADRMTYMLAGARPGVAVMAAIGVNSYGSPNTAQQMADGYDSLVSQIIATGATPILATILPSGTTSDPTPINTAIKARTDVGLVIDANKGWADNGGYLPNTDQGNADSLHPNVTGGINAGRKLADALTAAGYELGAAYGATGSPADNIVAGTVWTFTGIGGTKAGANSAGISGNVPTGCTVTLVSAGVTATVSVVDKAIPCLVEAPGGGWTASMVTQKVLRIALSGTASASSTNSVTIDGNISPGEAAGSTYEGQLYAHLRNNALDGAPAANINIGLSANSATLFTWSNANTKANSGYITQAVEGIMRGWTRGAVQATGTNKLLFQFRLNAGAVDCAIDLAMPYFRKVDRTAFAIPMAVHNGRDDLGGPVAGPTVGSGTTWTATAGVATSAVRPGEAWSGGGLTFSYQWQKSPDAVTWTDIAGATAATYTPVAGDGRLRCNVTATNTFGNASSATAASTNSV